MSSYQEVDLELKGSCEDNCRVLLRQVYHSGGFWCGLVDNSVKGQRQAIPGQPGATLSTHRDWSIYLGLTGGLPLRVEGLSPINLKS